MAFVKLEKGLKKTKDGVIDIRMGTHRTKSGRSIYFSISEATAITLGWQIIQTETKRRVVRLAFNEGVGEDKGLIQISEDLEDGYHVGADHKNAGSYAINVMANRLRHYLINAVADDSVSVAPVEFVLDETNKAVLVQVPDWLRYNPLSDPDYKEEAPQKKAAPPKLTLTPPPREEKKEPKPRPTLSVVNSGADDDNVMLNRKQRRLAMSVVTRAMR